jgi:spermidine synthase
VIVESLGDGLSRVWTTSETLVDTHTAYQHVVIARTAHGVTLFCDDDRQSSELSQLVYHEALLVPALLLAPRLDNVLIIGSSEGVVTQLALTAGARHVDHVDIDREAVELCARHLPYGYSPEDLAGGDRFTLHFTDGWDFVAGATARYDIVVVDLPDEHPGPAQHNRLYQVDFLARCRAVLTDGGVVATQAGCPTLWRNATLVQSWQRFHEVFDAVTYYGSDEHEWAFLFGHTPTTADPNRRLPDQPRTIDAEALRARTTPPLRLRTQRFGQEPG